MSFTSNTLWEVETGGSDTNNGGGFDTSATFPTDGAATSANTSAPVFTSASYNFVAGDVGAWIYIKSGTNWTPGWYNITSVASNAATLSAAIGAGVSQYEQPTTVLGCATTASPTGATWGIDYSQSGSSRITFTDMVIGGTTTQFTSAANPVGKNFIGNTIKVTSGTGFTVQRVYVVSTSGTTATCDKSLGTGASTGGNGRLGGALSSMGLASSLVLSFGGVYVKTGSYSITSASVSVTVGCFSGTGKNNLRLIGYSTVRGDMGTPPVLTASGISAFTMITALPSDSYVANFTLDGASLTTSRGIDASAGRVVIYKVWAKNFTNTGLYGFNNLQSLFISCRASGCGTQPATLISFGFLCEAYSNTVAGFGDGSAGTYLFCIAYSNTGASSDGFANLTNNKFLMNCVAYANGRDGYRFTGQSTLVNCIAEANTGVGIKITAGIAQILNCAVYNNTGGDLVKLAATTELLLSLVTGTGSFFTNAASADFSLNNTAGAGASARAVGIPGVTPDGLSTGFLDIGAIQHADPAAGVSGSWAAIFGG